MKHRGLALLSLASCFVIAGVAHGNAVEFIYVEPNVGSSAGGHSAVRFGDRVYDFQNDRLDTLRLRRSGYDHFRYLYTVLENRTIEIVRVEVPQKTRDALLDRFNRRYLIQNKHFSVLASLRKDRELIHRLLDRQTADQETPTQPETSFPLRGSGFFDWDGENARVEASEAMLALRRQIEEAHGQAFLSAKIAELEGEISRLAPDSAIGPRPIVSKDDRPVAGYLFSDRYSDLCLKILALRALVEALPLAPGVTRVGEGDDFLLAESEMEKLGAFSELLASSLVELAGSRRPDWGFAMLLGMARLQALDESHRSGRLVVLDAFAADSESVSASEVRRRSAFFGELSERARSEFEDARRAFVETDEVDESDFAWLEDMANRHLEFQRGLAEVRAIRLRGDEPLPAPSAVRLEFPVPRVEAHALQKAAVVAADRERAYAEALKETFGYDLLSQNCVTEIFATIEAELGRSELEERLGAQAGSSGLHFVPSVAFAALADGLGDAAVTEVPSYRRTRLAEMYAAENDLRVYLRESSTLGSSIYRWNHRDSFFLFFTDDAIATRPVYGALNVVAGLGEMTLGLLRAPLDRGETFWSGLKGVAFSLPELLFLNLRKGTLEYAPGETPRTLPRPQYHYSIFRSFRKNEGGLEASREAALALHLQHRAFQ